MKKIIVAILTLSMILVLITGCGGGSSAGNASTGGNASASGDDDTVYEVVFSSQEVDSSVHSRIAIELWANKIEEATNGRVKFVYYWGSSISGVPELLDNLESGAVDAAWAATSAYAGRYTATKGVTLPGLGLIAGADGAEAIWQWLQEEEPTNERGTLVLAACYPAGDMYITNNKKEIKVASDFYGLRLRPLNSAWQAVFEKLDVVPVSFGMNDTYENIEKNICDGLVQDFVYYSWSRIYEVSQYYLDKPMSINIGFLYLSPHFLNRLPDDLREIVLSCGGLELSRQAGAMILESQEAMQKDIVDNGGIIYPATAEISDLLENSFEAGRADWIKECDARDGYDGQELYDRLIKVTSPYFGK
ncbi:MAG: TRAP transporter substrate-binding protein DctP [Clostridiales Family XIII bacterium]|nr:TRAP transporter substrate-binding protein DctP [Clostridiales Family XIII bacterium]